MNREQPKAPEDSPENKIEEAASFEELYEIIKNLGEVKGTQKSYPPEELTKIIEDVREGNIELEYVTREHGLRAKVRELREAEKDKTLAK